MCCLLSILLFSERLKAFVHVTTYCHGAILNAYMAIVPYLSVLEKPNVDSQFIKVTFRTTQSVLSDLKHIAADKNANVTYVLNDALSRYIESYNISTFKGDKLRTAVGDLMVLTMKRLKQRTNNDETVGVDIDLVYEEACAAAGSPGGIGSYDSTNQTLKNRVMQELLGREFIRKRTSGGKVTVTYKGKISPEFL